MPLVKPDGDADIYTLLPTLSFPSVYCFRVLQEELEKGIRAVFADYVGGFRSFGS